MKALLLAAALAAEARAGDFEFGVHLFKQGDYYRAVTELERHRFQQPRGPQAEAALRLIAAAYFKGQQWEQAAERFGEHAASFPRSPLAFESRLFRAEALYESRQVFAAREEYQPLLGEGMREEWRALARLRLACLDLVEGKWREAAGGFEDPRWKAMALEGARFEPHAPALLALSSAVIPGSGQMKAGYWRDGWSALALVGSFAGWAAYFFWRGEREPGAVFSLVAGVFHIGNIQGAYNAGRRANRDKPRAKMKEILDEVGARPPLQPDLRPHINEEAPKLKN